jgi:hypothetical protein
MGEKPTSIKSRIHLVLEVTGTIHHGMDMNPIEVMVEDITYSLNDYSKVKIAVITADSTVISTIKE